MLENKIEEIERQNASVFKEINDICFYNSKKVLDAFIKNKIRILTYVTKIENIEKFIKEIMRRCRR